MTAPVRRYTAEEMLEMADNLDTAGRTRHIEKVWTDDTAAMLRQAAADVQTAEAAQSKEVMLHAVTKHELKMADAEVQRLAQDIRNLEAALQSARFPA